MPLVYKYENDSWTGYWAQLCNDRICFCCKELLPGATEKDTLFLDFENGIYRIECNFTMKPGNIRRAFYSNTFIFESS